MSYSKIEFHGKLLQPNFSIYLFEIETPRKEKFYYVGMTGDNFYPSARSAIHRLSGHFELNKRSTQNQLKKALDEKLISAEVIYHEETKIIMHHWVIDGFEPWKHDGLGGFNKNKMDTNQHQDYDEYKILQKKVLILEQEIIRGIFEKAPIKCLNKSIKGKSNLSNLQGKNFKELYHEIISRVQAD